MDEAPPQGPPQIVDDVLTLIASLDEVTTWLEGTEAFRESHGAHTAAVEARKLLARLREGT